MTTYARCAEVATEIARYIREELGYPAWAHHNGSFEIQAIPVFHEVGFGELGRHGSLIHPQLGSNFRPGFVTTDLPLAYDQPYEFGVQDYCIAARGLALRMDHGRTRFLGHGRVMTDTPQVLLAHHLKTLKLPTFSPARPCSPFPRQLQLSGRIVEQEAPCRGQSGVAPRRAGSSRRFHRH